MSRDRNLSLTKFQVLAESLPESARTCDDGLYRAVDSYLKASQVTAVDLILRSSFVLGDEPMMVVCSCSGWFRRTRR